METQNWPIRSKIVALVVVPIVALMALWIFATTLTVGPASSLLATRTLLEEIGRPGETLVAELQKERRLSVMWLADPAVAPALTDQRARTDHALAELRRRVSDEDVRDVTSETLDARLDQLLGAAEALPSGRGFIDQRSVDAIGALGLYSGIIDAAFRTFSALQALPDENLSREVGALTDLGRAREVLAQADALLAGVFRAGRFGPGEHTLLVQIIGTQRFLSAAAVAELPDAERTRYQQLTEAEPFRQLRAMEDDLIGRGRSGAAAPVDSQSWQLNHELVQQQLREFELSGAEDLAERSRPVAAIILIRLGLAGLLGFVAVLVSGIIALRIGRSLVRRLTSLRAAALAMANERLPNVVARLRRGEEVDVAAEAPSLHFGQDEIGQLGQAFSEVQRTAIRSAVDEAAFRKSLRDVFLNIARRNQTLLHRQLALLDTMERRVTEPTELADLFRLDHMATRMRRHAEDLVVLAGAAPGRGWRNPVAMIDVIRGAISEVEDYARVDLGTVPPAALVGPAVGDVIHLLAELIENATSFSPPHTRVRVTGQLAAKGYAIEIEDRGLGMDAEAIEQANRRLAEPPDFDPADSARLGLYVVARLGARHNVQVRLRPSPHGGIIAVALVPSDLVVPESAVPAARDGKSASRKPAGAALAGRGPKRTVPTVGAGRDAGAEPGASGAADAGAEPDRRAGTPADDSRSVSALGPRRRAGEALNALIAATTGRRAGTPDPDGGAPETDPVPEPDRGAARTDGGAPETDPGTPAPPPAAGTGGDDTVVLPAVRLADSADPERPADRPAAPVRVSEGPIRPVVAPAGPDGLPRRIRQTNLAPQLRTPGPGAGPSAAGRAGSGAGQGRGPGGYDPSDEPSPRSPEQVRAVMAALQAGTARGRRDSGVAPPSIGNPDDTARVADPGTTDSERDG
ncbi:nitrate- and nitrite sensing domain-containing protein [Micromonospora sp. HM5-17]|uniref:sensor histidine kinase n=1 Tax=Micromonospora sp. HM5-17 TaxID=2487710 RepID=UPI000F483E69|nr:nitrate- and nitrite sensing domain-containing protein [Micromonospora sp. HM5-17]ROT32370.1 HAMP domain-containing protein [Micromonospora sp. HM5-17]